MNIIEENENTVEKQVVIECGKYDVVSTLRKYFATGHTFVNQFMRAKDGNGDNDHVIILQKPDDSKPRRKN
jgi:hypothetical protein